MACETSQDCIELFNDTVLRLCYLEASFSSEENFCFCSNWYGWVGNNCNEESIGLWYYRIALIFTTLISSCLLTLFMRYLFKYFHLLKKERKHSLQDSTSISVLYTVGVLYSLSTLSILLYSILELPSAFNSKKFIVQKFNELDGSEVDQIISFYGNYTTILLIISVIFMLFGSLTIILSWIDVLKQISKYFPTYFTTLQQKGISFLKIFLVLSTIVSILLLTFGNGGILSLFVSILLFIVLIIYSWLTFSFLRVLKKIMKNNNQTKLKSTIKLVSRTYILLAICMVVGFCLLLTVSILLPTYPETLVPGEFNYILFLVHLSFWTELIKSSVALWYITKVTQKRIKSEDENEI